MSPMNTHFSIGDPAVLSERYFEYYKARQEEEWTYNYNPCKGGKNIDPYPLTYGYATFDSVSQIKYFNEITEWLTDMMQRLQLNCLRVPEDWPMQR